VRDSRDAQTRLHGEGSRAQAERSGVQAQPEPALLGLAAADVGALEAARGANPPRQ
jgi:hypothetical protein